MRRSPIFRGLAGALCVLAGSVFATAEVYTLGTMDKLNIRIVEWQTTEDAVRDWSTISGEYVVGPAGVISIPIVGEVEASGRTTADVATEIGDALQQTLGLMDRPEASVELAEYRPFFLTGDVATPGRYPFDPNLTVLKAVSIAGGMRRSAETGQRVERDFINASGDVDVLSADRMRLIARKARLEAETTGSADIEFPQELRSTGQGQKLIEDETAFRDARAERLERQLAAIDDLKELLESEIVALERKIKSQNEQIELSREQLAGIGDLADRGLVVNERVLSIGRSVADLEGRVLDMETAALRAKQDIAQATQDANALRNDRDAEVAQELQQAEANLEAANLKILTSNSLMQEALSIAPEVGAAEPDVSYVIVREIDGEPQEMPAQEHTPVLPGDVLKVKIEPVAATAVEQPS
ncbi:polysaccharide biosynthesis/export family protein [Mesorhizobium sp. YIM 152430]|uniref:polysaccharide biosynthesis/export family protein n=1 Tax=Mesorhizobium sp. YIM 152430 TaxID=3031761 RepID=UPI0023D9836E|nr:polysaccharide biosynthesis/export family protein [Mesorhizobium sp. YIM 152430]MDF1600797.1 polysaccharide biosynthesis/export family protein [Mesorhizobium sp. YIM 152430]